MHPHPPGGPDYGYYEGNGTHGQAGYYQQAGTGSRSNDGQAQSFHPASSYAPMPAAQVAAPGAVAVSMHGTYAPHQPYGHNPSGVEWSNGQAAEAHHHGGGGAMVIPPPPLDAAVATAKKKKGSKKPRNTTTRVLLALLFFVLLAGTTAAVVVVILRFTHALSDGPSPPSSTSDSSSDGIPHYPPTPTILSPPLVGPPLVSPPPPKPSSPRPRPKPPVLPPAPSPEPAVPPEQEPPAGAPTSLPSGPVFTDPPRASQTATPTGLLDVAALEAAQPDVQRYDICTTVPGDLLIPISPNTTGVTWRGWGTSLAWWSEFVGGFTDEDDFNAALDLVFSADKGLGLNLVRYLLPATFNATFSPLMAAFPFHLEGYRPDPNGPYQWDADAAQRRVLQAALQRGVTDTDAVVYSPPWWATINGDVSGGHNGNPNLRPGSEAAFVEYIADVLQHFSTDWGVTFNTVSPFNEALEGWWHSGRDREGCSFTLSEANVVIPELAAALQQRGLPIAITGMDSWVDYTVGALGAGKEHLTEDNVRLLSRLMVHGYQSKATMGADKALHLFNTFRATATQLGKEVWQSEWGPIAFSGTDMQMAALLARTITSHINYLGVSAWFFWQAMEKNNPTWGAIRAQWDRNYKHFLPFISKQYYAMMHFTRFMPRGSMPVSVAIPCGFCIAASIVPQSQRLTIIVTSQQLSDRLIELPIIGFQSADGSGHATVTVWRTSSDEDFVQIDSYKVVVPGAVGIMSRALSITTVVLDNVAPS